jgi:sugar phosphate isomerase/epimerase
MGSHAIRLDLGINGAFITRRWERPESMMRLTAETGYRVHEFCADVMDPFFMGPKDFLLEMAREVRQWADYYEITICDIYTGVATHRFHGFSHSRPEPGERMKQWLYDCWDICLAMGTDRWGGHVDAVPVEVMQDPTSYRKAIEKLHRTWRELSVVARDKGMGAIYVEQMYIPSEVPWTLEQTQEMLMAVNRENDGVPVYVTLDVGHMAGMHYGLTGPDLDYREWIRRFAPWAEVIHLQQTTPDASHHWPFTAEYNQRGHVRMEAVMDALVDAHRHAESSPISEVLAPVDHHFFILELVPGSTKNEETLLREMKESAEYLQQFVPREGMTLSI